MDNRNSTTALTKVASNRDLISTHEYGTLIDKTAQTIRKNYCLTGEAFGIRPIKIGNRLMWRVNDVARLIEEGETKLKKTPTSVETKVNALSKPNSNTEQVWRQAND